MFIDANFLTLLNVFTIHVFQCHEIKMFVQIKTSSIKKKVSVKT